MPLTSHSTPPSWPGPTAAGTNGAFAEVTRRLDGPARLIGGARLDRHTAEDHRATLGGGMGRLVDGQHRVDAGNGTVVGRDLDDSGGFATLALNGAWRVNRSLRLSAGVDNLFDRAYAEHLNLAGNAGFGFPGDERINEPGRTVWARADLTF